MKRTKRTLWWVIAGPLVVLAAIVIEAFPYLAITEPSGAKVLVVEGWMDPGALQEAAQLAMDSAYTQVYTTGTVRAFAYYLEPTQGLAVRLHDPAQGTLSVNVSGNTGTGFRVIADNDTLLQQAVSAFPHEYSILLAHPVSHIRLEAWHTPMAPHLPAIYVSSMSIHGMNINLLQERSWFTKPDSMAEPAWPTYAQSARAALIRMGVPASIITAVPAYGAPRSRSWGNAHAFGIQARQDDLIAFDVATVGVHARRSRNLFQKACGPNVKVGIIALHDPFCTRSNWWRSFRGWITLLKEVVGAPEAEAVQIKRWK